jgi:predicted phosphoadenosine phosphosulfate sulfurtransferase
MKQKIDNYIYSWNKKGYIEIPDEGDKRLEDLNKIPSYKKICLAILKNDYSLKTLGLTQTKAEVYHDFKKIQLGISNNQLKLKL